MDVQTKPNFYLIQRAVAAIEGNTFRENHPINWDYMGASEFEGGTIGTALAALGLAKEKGILTGSLVKVKFGPTADNWKRPENWVMVHTHDYTPPEVIDLFDTKEVPCYKGTTIMLPIADTFAERRMASALEKQPCCAFILNDPDERVRNITIAAMDNRITNSIRVFRNKLKAEESKQKEIK